MTGIVAVLASAGVLGTRRHAARAPVARSTQAQEKLAVVGDAASMRIGEWVAGNLRTGASVTAAAAPDAITKAMGEATHAGFSKKRRASCAAAHPTHAPVDFISAALKVPTRAGNDAKPDAAAAAAMAAIAGLSKSAARRPRRPLRPRPPRTAVPPPLPPRPMAAINKKPAAPAPAPAPAAAANGGAAAAAAAAMAAISKHAAPARRPPRSKSSPRPRRLRRPPRRRPRSDGHAAAAPSDAASAAAPAPAADDQALRTALGQAVASGDFRTVYMAYDADKRFVQVPPQKLPDGYDPTGRPWYKAAVASGKPIVTEPYKDASFNDMTVTFALPVKADGKLVGVIGADKSLAEVVRIVNGIKPSENSYAFIIDKQGRILSIRTPTWR